MNSRIPRDARRLLTAGFWLVLAGCASTGQHVSGVMQVTLKPGDTGNCDSSPCQVDFQMPPGSGRYQVTGNEVEIGVFPAGQLVSLGSFWESNAIKVIGWGTENGEDYWLCVNSWNDTWGDNGLFKILMGDSGINRHMHAGHVDAAAAYAF